MSLGTAVYALIALVISLWLYRAHINQSVDIDLYDLLKENGKLSKISVAFLVTLFTSSWYVVHEATEGTLSDVAFGSYLAAWVAPIVAHVLKGTPTPDQEK